MWKSGHGVPRTSNDVEIFSDCSPGNLSAEKNHESRKRNLEKKYFDKSL